MPQRLRIIILAIAFIALGVVVYPRIADSRLPGNHEGYSPEQPIQYSHRLHAGELGIPCMYCHFAAEKGRAAGIPPANVCMNCHRSVAEVTGRKLGAREDLMAAAKAAKDDLSAAAVAEPPMPPSKLKALREKFKAAQAAVDVFNPNTLLSPEIAKLYDHVGFDPKTMKPIPGAESDPIRWVRVHRLPDYVYFDHSAHIHAGVDCQKCHGPIETMGRVRQTSTLWMGWCVNCHRDAHANGVKGKPAKPSLNCTACHY